MKQNVDLTENFDFSGGGTLGVIRGLSTRDPRKPFNLRMKWTEYCLHKPSKFLREYGVRMFSSESQQFPPPWACECCGRTAAPWSLRNGLCKGCSTEIVYTTPEENFKNGLPRNPSMKSIEI